MGIKKDDSSVGHMYSVCVWSGGRCGVMQGLSCEGTMTQASFRHTRITGLTHCTNRDRGRRGSSVWRCGDVTPTASQVRDGFLYTVQRGGGDTAGSVPASFGLPPKSPLRELLCLWGKTEETEAKKAQPLKVTVEPNFSDRRRNKVQY